MNASTTNRLAAAALALCITAGVLSAVSQLAVRASDDGRVVTLMSLSQLTPAAKMLVVSAR
jgi:hypothetical protein